MLNWSLSLRTQTDFISPEGPNFQRAPWIKIDVDGTHIKFKAPRNNTSAPVEVVHPDRNYDLNKIHSKLFGEGDYQWRSTTLITRHWNFNGPWLTGKCGTIRMSAWIMSPFNITEGLNFFHPRALENGIANYLTFRYGEHQSTITREQMWLAPMNWQPRTNLPCIAARFDAIVNKLVFHEGPNSLLILPIGKHHIFLMHCSLTRHDSPPELTPRPIDEWVDPKPFLELTQQVLDSLEITLSPEAQAQQEEALRGLQDKSLTPDFPPLKWTKSDTVPQ